MGGERSSIEDLDPAERLELVKATRDRLYSEGITQAKRCELMKCHAYCSKKYLNTCREWQFRNACTLSQPSQYGCDVDCNSASQKHLSSTIIIAWEHFSSPLAL